MACQNPTADPGGILDPVEAAFLVTIGTGGPLGHQAAWGVSRQPGRQILGFEVGDHHRWTDRSGHLSVDAWGAAAGPRPWHVDPGHETAAVGAGSGGIAVTAGQPWWRGPIWSEPAEWPQEMWKRGDGKEPADLRRELGGVHVSLRVGDDGDGWVSADPLGQRCLYVAERDEVLYVGSRAALVAAAISENGSPERDLRGTAWLAFMGFRSGGSTGFAGVRSIPSNTALRLRAGRPHWDTEAAVEVPVDDESRRRSLAEQAEVILDELGTVMRAVLSRSAPGPIVQLTGGKDSRVLLAAALRAGVARDITFETIGPPKLDDVILAAKLTERFGLHHDVRFLGLRPKDPYAERARDFVELTAAGLNLWDIDARIGSGEIRLTGVVGATLRASGRLAVSDSPEEDLHRWMPFERFDRLGVLDPALSRRMHEDLIGQILAHGGPSTSAHDLLQGWYVATEPKFSRLAARLEIPGDIKIPVLASWPIVRASSSVDPLDRQDHVLVAEALRQVSPDLLEVPFTDPGWPPRARAHLNGEPPPPPPAPPRHTSDPAHPPSAPKASKSTSLVERLGSQGDERVRLLDQVFSDGSSPAWDLFNREVARDALGRYDDLTNGERKALFGVATAVIWSDG